MFQLICNVVATWATKKGNIILTKLFVLANFGLLILIIRPNLAGILLSQKGKMKRKRYPFTRHESKCKGGSINPLILNVVARWNECLASLLGRFA
jgi:hypothetical protein